MVFTSVLSTASKFNFIAFQVLGVSNGKVVESGGSGDAKRMLVGQVEHADEAHMHREVPDKAFAGTNQCILHDFLHTAQSKSLQCSPRSLNSKTQSLRLL